MPGTVLLVRRDSPAFERAVPADRQDLGRVRVVEVRHGQEDRLEPCDRAVSYYPVLVRPYGDRGEVLVPSGDKVESPPSLVVPAGYVVVKAGPYYRLYDPDGAQVGDKALYRADMIRLLEEINGSLG